MRPIRFGATIPPSVPVALQVKLAVLFEKFGFDSLWFPDHLLFPDHSGAPDCWSVMAAVAMRTKRVLLGTGVSDPHRFHPAVLAQRLATLDQLSRGRVILGLGSGEAMNLEPFGIPWDRKVARLREAVTVIRGLLDSPEPFDFQGDFYQLKRARLGVRPWLGRKIPIYLAALGPLMQKFAGQVADGWYPVCLPVDHYGEFYAPIAEAARAAGRDPGQIDRVANLPLAIVEPDEWSTETFEKLARMYAMTLVWPVALERMGMPWNPPEHLKEVNYITINPCDDEQVKRYDELQSWVPLEVMEKFVSVGNVEQMAGILQRYIDQGATHFAISNATPDPLIGTARLCGELIPRFTGRSTLVARTAARVFPIAKKFGLMPKMPNPIRSKGD